MKKGKQKTFRTSGIVGWKVLDRLRVSVVTDFFLVFLFFITGLQSFPDL